jgi:hypothetical protein
LRRRTPGTARTDATHRYASPPKNAAKRVRSRFGRRRRDRAPGTPTIVDDILRDSFDERWYIA